MISRFNLFVLRANDLTISKQFYETLLDTPFLSEQHPGGPLHYSTTIDGIVFELYPAAKSVSEEKVNASLKPSLGFIVKSLDKLIEKLNIKGIIYKGPSENDWGRSIVVYDPDRYRIELMEEKL